MTASMRELVPLNLIQFRLLNEGIPITIRTLGGLKVLITFDSPDTMKVIHGSYSDLFNTWCKFISLYSLGFKTAVWVRIENLPIHLWHIDVFHYIGSL